MSLASPLGDPSDSKVEFEIILLSAESLLSLISSTDRTLYLLLSLAHPDWHLGLRLFLEPSSCFVQRYSLYGLGPITALALVFLFVFSTFSLIPGGCTFFCLGTAGLVAALALMGAVLLMTAAKEFTFTALQLWLLTFLGEAISTAVEAFVVAALGGINIHGIRVPCLGPFCCSRFNKIKELLSAPCLFKVFLKVHH